MTWRIPVLSDAERQTLLRAIDTTVRTIGAECVLDIAPVLLKVMTAEQIPDKAESSIEVPADMRDEPFVDSKQDAPPAT